MAFIGSDQERPDYGLNGFISCFRSASQKFYVHSYVYLRHVTVIRNDGWWPTFIISTVFMVLWPNTMAFGAVATGRAKAYEHTIPGKQINNLRTSIIK